MTYSTQLQQQRVAKDRFFKLDRQSPIPYHLRINFTHLDYFEVKEDYKFNLALQPYDDVETIQMDTSDGQIKDYLRIGYLEFEVGGENAKINVYQSAQNPDHYFVPFRDKTSGQETYGAGRYLDLENHGGKFELDFNLAYNPYCAYNENYSCPLPPFENWLEIKIEAGEKDFPLNN